MKYDALHRNYVLPLESEGAMLATAEESSVQKYDKHLTKRFLKSYELSRERHQRLLEAEEERSRRQHLRRASEELNDTEDTD